MSEVAYSVQRLGDWGYEYTWPETTGTYWVWSYGRLVSELTQARWSFDVPPGSEAEYEIFDAAGDRPSYASPGRVSLDWYGVTGAARYRVDRWEDAAWVLQAHVAEDGRTYYTWESARLEDGVTHTFRVVPEGSNGVDGDALGFAALLVRHPDAPAVSYGYDAVTGVVTVS